MTLYVNLAVSHSHCFIHCFIQDEEWLSYDYKNQYESECNCKFNCATLAMFSTRRGMVSYDDKINMNRYKFSSVTLMLFNTREGVAEQ